MNEPPRVGQPRRPLWNRYAGSALLFLFGLAASLYYGRRGYMPLDQSIVFDGGWRILSGQVPFRDYHSPNGFTVHALQAAFFALGGVSWFTYCLHAAVVNGLFAVLVKHLLVRMGLFAGAAWAWGALSALVLYPPFGVPYMDQHAFFFSLVAVTLAVLARQTEEAGRMRPWAWLALPTVLLLAGLSKQIPSAFAIPVVLAVALADGRDAALRRARGLALGFAFAIGLLVLSGVALGMDLERVDTYFRRLPAEEGVRRFAFVPGIGPILERMRYTGERLGLRSIGLVHGATVLGMLSLCGLFFAGRSAATRERLFGPLRAVLLAEALLVVCLLFIALTSNQPEIGVPYVFVAGGLIHAALERARDSLLRARRVWLAGWSRVLALLLLGVALVDGWHFTRTVNATRSVNDITWSPEVAGLAAPRVHPDLAFMRWQLPPIVPYGPAHLRDLVEFLKVREAPFLLIGDASIVYGLCRQPSVAPSLWFHPGLTLPLPDDPALAEYETLLLERVEAFGIRFLVLEHPHSWIHTSLASFPRLEALVAERRGDSARFGGFEVIWLGPWDQGAGAKSP